MNSRYGLAIASLLTALSAPLFANETAAPVAPAASATSSYQPPAQSIDCRRAPGRALAMLRDSMNPCNRDGLPQRVPKAAAAPRAVESTAAAQAPVTAAPAEAQAAPTRVDRSDCPQTAAQPEKRPRHMLFLHLT